MFTKAGHNLTPHEVSTLEGIVNPQWNPADGYILGDDSPHAVSFLIWEDESHNSFTAVFYKNGHHSLSRVYYNNVFDIQPQAA